MKPLKPRPTLRTFIAVQPDPNCVEQIYHNVDTLKRRLDSKTLRWIPSQNWHITLAFLGNKTHKEIDLLTSTLDQAREEHAPFLLSFDHFDWFPSLFKPKVLACLAQPSSELSQIAKSAAALAKAPGKQRNTKEFRGHLSVARPQQKNVTPLDSLLTVNAETSVEGFSLFESELRPEGVRYHAIAYFKLGPVHTT